MALFESLVWESDSVAFCHGLLADLIKDLKALKKVTFDDQDSMMVKEVSYSKNASSLNIDKSTILGPSQTKPSSEKLASIRNVKITTGTEKYPSMSAYRQVLEASIRESLAHQQATRQIVSSESLAENVKKTFADVSLFD